MRLELNNYKTNETNAKGIWQKHQLQVIIKKK